MDAKPLSVAKWVCGIGALALLIWLALDSSPRQRRLDELSRALRQHTIGTLPEVQSRTLEATLAGISAALGLKTSVALNQPFRDGSLNVYTTTPSLVETTHCPYGNVIYDAELDAIFIDQSILDDSDYRSLYQAAGESSILSFGELPFLDVYVRFVLLHELGHRALHRNIGLQTPGGVHALARERRREIEAEADEYALRGLQALYRWDAAHGHQLVGAPLNDTIGLSEFFGPKISDEDRVWVDLTGMLWAMSVMNLFISTPYSPYFTDEAHPTYLDRAASLVSTVLSSQKLIPALHDHLAFFQASFRREAEVAQIPFVEVRTPKPVNDAVLDGAGLFITSLGNREVMSAPESRLTRGSGSPAARVVEAAVQFQEPQGETDPRKNVAIWARPGAGSIVVNFETDAHVWNGRTWKAYAFPLAPPFTTANCFHLTPAPQPSKVAVATTCAEDFSEWIHAFSGDDRIAARPMKDIERELATAFPGDKLSLSVTFVSDRHVYLAVERADAQSHFTLGGVAILDPTLQHVVGVPLKMPPELATCGAKCLGVLKVDGQPRFAVVGSAPPLPTLTLGVWEVFSDREPSLLASHPFLIAKIGESARPDLIANFDPYYAKTVSLPNHGLIAHYANDSMYYYADSQRLIRVLFHPAAEDLEVRAGNAAQALVFERGGHRVFVFDTTVGQ
jgi:hypothetical protein